MKLSEEYIRNQLREYHCKVVFEKINGDSREMLCTLNQLSIPEEDYPEGSDPGRVRKVGLVSAYDLDSEGWRSFYVDRVKEFEPVIEVK